MYFVILAFILIASSLIWYLLTHDHGRKLPVVTLWYACGFGVLALAIAMVAEHFFVPKGFVLSSSSFSLRAQLGNFMGVGLVEEAAKFLPLALFIYKREYFREYTDGCIYFAVCGLTFGLVENVLYTVNMGTSVGLARLLLTPFLHAATTSILGYYLIRHKLRPDNKVSFGLALLLVPVMHGVYDFGLGASVTSLVVVSLMITLLFTLGLFLYFMEANELDKRGNAMRPLGYVLAPVKAEQSHNFCITCGQANTYHRAYCEHCGRKL
jgi:RsiW-degrading membrane proteinase PrsW (M82 family)